VAKYDERFKQKLVREYIAGKGGFKIIAGRYGIADSMLRKWVAAFRHHSASGLGGSVQASHEFLDIPVAQAEAKVQPVTMTDDLVREAATVIMRFRRVHLAS
jgi:transposase-like protein